jgi:outer membrane receptor protein involved in Fe transport
MGADLDWADSRLTARLTAFYTTLSNQWTPVLGGADFPLGQVDNSGRSRLFGLEWDSRFQIDKSHQLQMSLGYLNTSYVDFVPFERDADLENVAGNDFAGAPKFSGALAVAGDYGLPWRWSAALSHHSGAFANANNSMAGSIPAATLLDLKASYRWHRFEFSVIGRNLLDEDYLETTPRVIRGTGLVEYTPGRPRSIGLAVQYAF